MEVGPCPDSSVYSYSGTSLISNLSTPCGLGAVHTEAQTEAWPSVSEGQLTGLREATSLGMFIC